MIDLDWWQGGGHVWCRCALPVNDQEGMDGMDENGPLLTIVTRHWPAGRRVSFEKMVASMAAQTRQGGWEQVYLLDDSQDGRGVAWADAQIQTADVAGQYVWLVDDDDWLEPDALAVVCGLIEQHWPDVVVVSGTHGICGTLPTERVRTEGPIWGQISGQDVVVSRALFEKHAWRYGARDGRNSGDIVYLEAIWANWPRLVWADRVLVHQMRNGFGRADGVE